MFKFTQKTGQNLLRKDKMSRRKVTFGLGFDPHYESIPKNINHMGRDLEHLTAKKQYAEACQKALDLVQTYLSCQDYKSALFRADSALAMVDKISDPVKRFEAKAR